MADDKDTGAEDEDTPEPETHFARARKWYIDLLEAEVTRKGQPGATLLINDHMRFDEIKTMAGAGAGATVSATVSVPLSAYSLELNAVTGEEFGWQLDVLAENSAKALSADTLLEAAKALAKPGEDAELELAEYEGEEAGAIYRARWAHRVDGVLVESNAIEVLVNGATGRVFGYNKVWHEPKVGNLAEER